ncbi:ABC transporter substrate-binding protein [Bacillus sp. JJ1566]|uniref:ABC transporter substrate-binding protein n=1 Tax=Bacillus sp. JJ1566 TaxID=3122961 RepID=UPI002FFF0A8A
MKFFDHLLVLSDHFDIDNETKTSIAHISQLLNCSERHVKTILRYLESEGYIKWDFQKGRGKKPRIRLLFTKDELYFQKAKRYVKEEKYQEAFHAAQALSDRQREEFQKWFLTHIGPSNQDISKQEVDVLRYPFYETNLIMDPLNLRSRHDSHMVKQIFDRLVEYEPSTNQLKPSIAHFWESNDGRNWSFYLQKGIRFHHGRELTAHDVKATFERFPVNDVLLENIDSIKVISKTLIQFQLRTIDYLFPHYLSSMKTSIVPIELVKTNEMNFRKMPIGSGPYQLTCHDEEMVRLEVFTDYFNRRPWLDKIEIIKTPTLFKWEATNPLLLTAPDQSWNEIRMIEEGAKFLLFNCHKNGPMRHRHLREQIYKIVNLNEYCETSSGNIVAHSFITSQSEKYQTPDSCNQTVIHKLDSPLKIAVQQIREGVNHEREAKILQTQLTRAGISSTIEIVDLQLFDYPETFQAFDLFVGGIALTEDRLLSLITTIQSKRLMLYKSFSDTMKVFVDQQIKSMKEVKDDAARWRTYFQIEEYLKSNYAIRFLTHRFHIVYKPDNCSYQNIDLDSSGRVDYRKVWRK